MKRDGADHSLWQLQMFDRSLKKRQKVRVLLELLGPLDQERCLMLTDGDNTGAMNWHFRAAGGRWTWAEMQSDTIPEMEEFLSEPVHRAAPDRLPFSDAAFDRVLIVDVHEHLANVRTFNLEIVRVLAPGGMAVISTPNGNRRLPVAVLKRLLGMSEAVYGHIVQGFSYEELGAMWRDVGLAVTHRSAYTRFFTEFVELLINFLYVKVLARKKRGEGFKQGAIAPTSSGELRSVGTAYRLYSAVFPLILAFSWLDALVPGKGGYALAVSARKPS